MRNAVEGFRLKPEMVQNGCRSSREALVGGGGASADRANRFS